jgi:hypothetical protein
MDEEGKNLQGEEEKKILIGSEIRIEDNLGLSPAPCSGRIDCVFMMITFSTNTFSRTRLPSSSYAPAA